jgi:hypothetical protein
MQKGVDVIENGDENAARAVAPALCGGAGRRVLGHLQFVAVGDLAGKPFAAGKGPRYTHANKSQTTSKRTPSEFLCNDVGRILFILNIKVFEATM